MTLWPSVAGVEEAELFSRCMASFSEVATTVCHAILPVVASRLMRTRSPFSSALVRKMSLSQMTGEEWPSPGSGVFQATLLVWDHWMGGLGSALMPSPRGPRNWGQFSALMVRAQTNVSTDTPWRNMELG